MRIPLELRGFEPFIAVLAKPKNVLAKKVLRYTIRHINDKNRGPPQL